MARTSSVSDSFREQSGTARNGEKGVCVIKQKDEAGTGEALWRIGEGVSALGNPAPELTNRHKQAEGGGIREKGPPHLDNRKLTNHHRLFQVLPIIFPSHTPLGNCTCSGSLNSYGIALGSPTASRARPHRGNPNLSGEKCLGCSRTESAKQTGRRRGANSYLSPLLKITPTPPAACQGFKMLLWRGCPSGGAEVEGEASGRGGGSLEKWRRGAREDTPSPVGNGSVFLPSLHLSSFLKKSCRRTRKLRGPQKGGGRDERKQRREGESSALPHPPGSLCKGLSVSRPKKPHAVEL